MNCLLKRHLAACIAAAVLCLGASSAFADTFSIAYLTAGVQVPVSGSYETFGTGATTTVTSYASSVVGNFTANSGGSFELLNANQYGGAGGSGLYLEVLTGNTVTLTTPTPVNFFGLWFSALDSGSELQFYNGATLVETFNAGDFISGVGTCPGNAYCGNPNTNFLGQNNGQQYAYINFLDNSGNFTSIVFSENNCVGCGFESDNETIGVNATTAPGTPLSGTPEPSSLVLLGSGMGALVAAVRRRVR